MIKLVIINSNPFSKIPVGTIVESYQQIISSGYLGFWVQYNGQRLFAYNEDVMTVGQLKKNLLILDKEILDLEKERSKLYNISQIAKI